jgi:propionyl-CoA carboxylase alpha chain
MKIEKLLISNRGEIACRIIRTAKKLGIKTVAIYSQEDSNALHVRLADEAFPINQKFNQKITKEYLSIKDILKIGLESGADAVHPGYGFLSESSEFASQVETNGLIFIGPNKKGMEEMGDKIKSKLIAKEAGVQCIPGFNGTINDESHALKIAHEIGYPISI